MTRLRWLTVLLPALLIGAIELISDTFLDVELPVALDVIVVVGTVLVLAGLFSRRAFAEIDRLNADVRVRNAALESRNASAQALRDVSVAIAGLADLDAVLQATVDSARSLLGAEVALLVLVGPETPPRLRARSGPDEAFDPHGQTSDDELRRFVPADRLRLAGVPVRRGRDVIGTLAVGIPGERAIDGDQLDTLASLADQAAIAIENDRLQAELRALAVRSERERIARELHDGVAQVLGYVNTKSQAAGELLASGRLVEAKTQLDELAAAARSTYVDVREAILGLSSPVAPLGGLVAALRAYARQFAEASKLAVQVDPTRAAEGIRLDPTVEDEVFRIVREALTNVRKHAAARRVVIRLDVAADGLVVDIADDGRGFDGTASESQSTDWPQVGLIGMRERAAAMGGQIEWRSEAGGTTVHLTVPIDTGDMALIAPTSSES